MKHRLRDLLCCPNCGAYPLDLTVLETGSGAEIAASATRCSAYCSWQSESISEPDHAARPCGQCYAVEIMQGILHCDGCRRDFPIIDGVPRFNPDAASDSPDFFRRYQNEFRHLNPADLAAFHALHSQTKRSFGFQWLQYRVTNHQENRAHFFRRTATTPEDLPGRLFFEAGCGMGRYLKVIADHPDAEAVGLDLSLAVNRAFAENRQNPFIHVVQGDILQLPLRPKSFDHVYSIGVLHHTPDTRRAFGSILKLARPGGRISIWVYHVWRPPELRGPKALHASLTGWVADTLRRITTRLPLRALHYLCCLAAPLGWLQLKIRRSPAPLRALLSPLLLIPCSNHPEWRVRILDTFDWYSPKYQWKHTVAEVVDWFREEGLVDISFKGFPVSVRGTVPAAPSEPPPLRTTTVRERPEPH